MAGLHCWAQMSLEEKLEALRADVNTALDMAEDHDRRIERLEQIIQQLSAGIASLSLSVRGSPEPKTPVSRRPSEVDGVTAEFLRDG